MSDPLSFLLVAATIVVIAAMAVGATLIGWRGWLRLKQLEVNQTQEGKPRSTIAARIELADLRERVRKLEAIADGSDI